MGIKRTIICKACLSICLWICLTEFILCYLQGAENWKLKPVSGKGKEQELIDTHKSTPSGNLLQLVFARSVDPDHPECLFNVIRVCAVGKADLL